MQQTQETEQHDSINTNMNENIDSMHSGDRERPATTEHLTSIVSVESHSNSNHNTNDSDAEDIIEQQLLALFSVKTQSARRSAAQALSTHSCRLNMRIFWVV
jgi:hypothetical protein